MAMRHVGTIRALRIVVAAAYQNHSAHHGLQRCMECNYINALDLPGIAFAPRNQLEDGLLPLQNRHRNHRQVSRRYCVPPALGLALIAPCDCTTQGSRARHGRTAARATEGWPFEA